ncbi:MAG: DUF1800 domain-containing protein [Blastocatellia bacterium]
MASFTFDDAAHLLRRAGFGGSPAEIDELVSRGLEGAVDFLLDYTQIDNKAMNDLLDRSFDFSNPFEFSKFNRGELQRWWFTRMVYTKRPFEEKMTLFWHNHFATAASKVDDIFMIVQNATLRQHALDRFDDLLLKVAQDPAMLLWLDGVTNVKGQPNENFGRELQELFTMGITDVVTGEPNYTEQDVQEIARAFTGWKFFQPRDSTPYTFLFIENPAEHDDKIKTVYGQALNFSGEDIIEIVSARRATARYLVWKLFNFFVYPLTTSSGDRKTIDKFADVYMNKNHSMKEVVRAILVSDEFFGERARYGLVKSPAELIVGSIRMLGAKYNPGTNGTQDGANILAGLSIILGQELFNPPDVAGWRHNLGWINTSTLLNRFTWADLLAINRTRNLDAPGVWLSQEHLRSFTKKTAKKTVRKLLSVLGPLDVDSKTVRTLRNYLETGDQGQSVEFVVNDQTVDKKVRGLVHLVMCLSEFQLN